MTKQEPKNKKSDVRGTKVQYCCDQDASVEGFVRVTNGNEKVSLLEQ